MRAGGYRRNPPYEKDADLKRLFRGCFGGSAPARYFSS
jgi:hypothetical protein